MPTMTVSLPGPLREWIETQIRTGEYGSASDYVCDLVRRDRARREQDIAPGDLRRTLAASGEVGVGARTVDAIFAEADEIARTRGSWRG